MSGPLGGLPVGFRATPNMQPAPNSVPVGALAGAPPRTKLYQQGITASAELIVAGTAENRIVALTAPLVGWGIWIGGTGVTPKTGMQLPAGLAFDIPIIGLQELYAVTDAPITIPLQIMVSIILFAERQRIVG